jgi:CubicO group peptidase (beta-lactamase class C family)
MGGLAEAIGQIAASTGFSGVVRIDRHDDSSFACAYGLAHRGHCIANTVDTRFGLASGTKGLTAATVMTLRRARRT